MSSSSSSLEGIIHEMTSEGVRYAQELSRLFEYGGALVSPQMEKILKLSRDLNALRKAERVIEEWKHRKENV